MQSIQLDLVLPSTGEGKCVVTGLSAACKLGRKKIRRAGGKTRSPGWGDALYYRTWDREGSLTRRPGAPDRSGGTAAGAVLPDSPDRSGAPGRSASLK